VVKTAQHGQVSIEYILIVAFTFAILIPGIYFFYTYTQSSSAGVASAQYGKLGQEMLDTAIRTVAQGEGSWLTLDANVPDGLADIVVADSGSELVIRYQTPVGPSEAVFFSEVNLSARTTSPATDGSVFPGPPHGGRTSFRFTAGKSGIVAIEEHPG
jgi:hypothetical protein